MDDDKELAALRAQRMAQLQQQMGGVSDEDPSSISIYQKFLLIETMAECPLDSFSEMPIAVVSCASYQFFFRL